MTRGMPKTIGPAVSAAVFVGCAAEPPTAALPHTAPEALAPYEPAHATRDGAAPPDLATLKRVTAPSHSFERAQAHGYTAKLTECMSSPEGGMGFHYANPGGR